MKLEFKPSDFKPPYPVLVSVEMSHLETIAAIANARLAEMLREAPVLNISKYGTCCTAHPDCEPVSRALLVNISPAKEDGE